MNTFLIGTQLEIHHYPDWSGSAFLAFEDAEYRIPGEAARILIETLRASEREQSLCSACGAKLGPRDS